MACPLLFPAMVGNSKAPAPDFGGMEDSSTHTHTLYPFPFKVPHGTIPDLTLLYSKEEALGFGTTLISGRMEGCPCQST